MRGAWPVSLFLFVILDLCSCSSPRSLDLQTEPSGATLRSLSNEIIGETPLALTQEKLSKVKLGNGVLAFEVSKPGYQSTQVLIEEGGIKNYQIKLFPENPNNFKNRLIPGNRDEAHSMVVMFLRAQGFLFAKQTTLAREIVVELLNKHPQIAASHVLHADLLIAEGKREDALKSLHAAIKLAPNDPDLRQRLQLLGEKL